LAKKDEIGSTEKLLGLIRHADSTPKTAPVKSGAAKSISSMIQPINFSKRRIIGVDVGHTYIKVAKVERLSEKSFEMIDYFDVPLPRPMTLQDSSFINLIKNNVARIVGRDQNYEIWSAIPSANVETRCIRIPKLPRKQIKNAIFWTFTQKVSFNEQEELLDYEILGDISEGGVKKTEVMTFKAPKTDIFALKAAFEKAGYPLKGITTAPFSVQNLFRQQIIPYNDRDICSLFIGRDWSRIAIYRNGNLVLSRGIKAGMRSMVEAIQLSMRKSDTWENPADQSAPVQEVPSDADISNLSQNAQRLFFRFINSASEDIGTPHDTPAISLERIFRMVLPPLERLIRQIERTFEHYSGTFNSEGIRRVFISGQVSACPTIVNYFAQQLELPVAVMNPFESSAFNRQIKVPGKESDRESFVPAIGLAVSDNSITPNFLFTHQNKDRNESIRRNNMRILTACMICLVALIAVFSWQGRQLEEKRLQYEKLNQQLLSYNPIAEKDTLLAMFAKTKSNQQTLRNTIQRFSAVAVLRELSEITPPRIRLLTTEVAVTKDRNTKTVTESRTLILDGVIFGSPNEFETMLSGYLFTLSNSPIFRKPSVQSKRIELYNAQEVLRFTAKVEIL
jgi:type IV pilus assembly protein PilM